MNSVHLIGRLTHDPQSEQTTSGATLTTFRVALDRPGREGADFVTVKAWGRVADTSAQHLTRGRRVAIQGRLEHSEWKDAEGRHQQRLTVVADRLQFFDPPSTGARRPDTVDRRPDMGTRPPTAAPR